MYTPQDLILWNRNFKNNHKSTIRSSVLSVQFPDPWSLGFQKQIIWHIQIRTSVSYIWRGAYRETNSQQAAWLLDKAACGRLVQKKNRILQRIDFAYLKFTCDMLGSPLKHSVLSPGTSAFSNPRNMIPTCLTWSCAGSTTFNQSSFQTARGPQAPNGWHWKDN